jgi:hypothetical protein
MPLGDSFGPSCGCERACFFAKWLGEVYGRTDIGRLSP